MPGTHGKGIVPVLTSFVSSECKHSCGQSRRSRAVPEVRTENLGHSEPLQNSRYGRSVITVSYQQDCFGCTAEVIGGVRRGNRKTN